MIFAPSSIAATCFRCEVAMLECYYDQGRPTQFLTLKVRTVLFANALARSLVMDAEERIAKKIAELGEPGDEDTR